MSVAEQPELYGPIFSPFPIPFSRADRQTPISLAVLLSGDAHLREQAVTGRYKVTDYYKILTP